MVAGRPDLARGCHRLRSRLCLHHRHICGAYKSCGLEAATHRGGHDGTIRSIAAGGCWPWYVAALQRGSGRQIKARLQAAPHQRRTPAFQGPGSTSRPLPSVIYARSPNPAAAASPRAAASTFKNGWHVRLGLWRQRLHGHADAGPGHGLRQGAGLAREAATSRAIADLGRGAPGVPAQRPWQQPGGLNV